MAYQTRHRDPLIDSNMADALERRGKEMLGLAFLGLGLALALILGSYVPDDPNWLTSGGAPARNLLGQFGATVASPLEITIGWGAWWLVVLCLVSGVRLIVHQGEDRIMSRIVFAPIATAVASVYASTHVPVEGWTHSFGLGGLFGDTVLGAVIGVAPVAPALALKAMAIVAGAALLWVGFFALGVDRGELVTFVRFLLLGVVMVYISLRTLVARILGGCLHGAYALIHWRAAHPHPEARPPRPTTPHMHREPRISRGEVRDDAVLTAIKAHTAAAIPAAPAAAPAQVQPRAAKRSFLSRVPGLMVRAPAPVPELVDHQLSDTIPLAPPSNERIQMKINDAIRNRRQPGYAPEHAGSFTHAPAARAPDPAPVEPDAAPLRLNDAQPETPPPAFVRPASAVRKVVQQVARRQPATSRRARAEAEPVFRFDDHRPAYEAPPLSLLSAPGSAIRQNLSDEALEENARMLEAVLDDYGVKGEIVSVRPGPVVTMYELEPAPGLKASRVIGLADDIARSMSALSARVSTVPGRTVIGIELPNAQREKVLLREILSSRNFGDGSGSLPLALGKDIGGTPVVANLAKMPHLLIAGTTGSGKSVAINTMILSLLYKRSPEECRLIMIDPKMLELSVYDGIPHLLSPVVTDPKKAVVALKWVVGEMEERYRKMSKMGVRNIEGFNSRVKDALFRQEMFSRTVQTGFDEATGEPIFETEEFAPEALPYIVVVVDEMADLMMVAGKEIEACIQRLAQMARASGIHLIMATQRPSVDVITGTIKANFPTRISFQVTSKVDSRTILGEQGAEQLLGKGDMLYMAGGAKIIRVHGPLVSDEEVEEVVANLKAWGPPEYVSGVVEGHGDETGSDIDLVLGLGGNTDSENALYDQAVAIVLKDRKCSTSYIQRKLAIGYNKAARLVEQMEGSGLVSAANHVGKREILVPEQH